jgi:hypothetical protein
VSEGSARFDRPEELPPVQLVDDLPGVVPDREEALTNPGSSRSHRRILTHGITLLVGVLLGASLATLLTGAPPQSALLVTDDPVCPPTGPLPPPQSISSEPPPAASPPNAVRPAWIARPASDAEILTLTGVILPVTTAVQHGDALIVTLMLTAACPGGVSVTDTRNNRYRIVSDVTDTLRHRTMVLAALGVNPLTTADSIRLTYPRSSKYHIAVDEFRGVSAAVGRSGAFGDTGGTAFTTSTHPITCAAGDLMIAAVGSNTGTAPTFSPGWNTLPALRLSSYRLTTAYQIAPATDTCAATGTTTSQWGAALAVFR